MATHRMLIVSGSKEKYSPSLFERLACQAPLETEERRTLRMISAEELKESVAHDLEAMLNARCSYGEALFESYPQALQSICSYGMNDFAGRSLANPADRHFICRSLERSIAIHERRLKQVKVTLEAGDKAVNRLKFSINAILVVRPSSEAVYFDALLQASTLQYSVNKSRRPALV